MRFFRSKNVQNSSGENVYAVYLYSGGSTLSRYVTSGYDEQDALENLAYKIRGSVYTIEEDEFNRIVDEFDDDTDAAWDYMTEHYVFVNGGEFYLCTDNITMYPVDEDPNNDVKRKQRAEKRRFKT